MSDRRATIASMVSFPGTSPMGGRASGGRSEPGSGVLPVGSVIETTLLGSTEKAPMSATGSSPALLRLVHPTRVGRPRRWRPEVSPGGVTPASRERHRGGRPPEATCRLPGPKVVVDGAHPGKAEPMRALQFSAYGGPEDLRWEDAPDPPPGAGQIRIAVRAASVNPADWKTMSGAMSGGTPLDGTGGLGFDAAGVVDEVGEGVSGGSVGDEVFGRGRNTQAEYAVLDAWVRKPPSIDWAVAAAAGVAGETSERGLRLLGVGPGDTVFVDGGAGGVGAVAVQEALARGARVIASAGEANQDYLREIGAIPVIYGEGVADRVRAAGGGGGGGGAGGGGGGGAGGGLPGRVARRAARGGGGGRRGGPPPPPQVLS